MTNLSAVRDEIKASALSNSAKLLAGYMAATGISDAKQIADDLGIPVRTIQRLKLDIATAKCAMDGAANSANTATGGASQTANDATGGVSEAPNAPRVALRARVDSINLLTSLVDSPVKKNNNPLPPSTSDAKPISVTEKPISGIAKPKSGPTPMDALTAFEAYNATALRCALPQAAKLTPDRQRKIIARLRDYGLDGWTQALANIERSSFLTGGNDRGWRANLEFLLQASSFAKVHDGGYGNGRHAQVSTIIVEQPAWIRETLEMMRS